MSWYESRVFLMALSIRRSTLIGIMVLVAWGLILCAGVIAYVHYDPHRLAIKTARQLTAQTGLHCDIRRVDLMLLPRPHLLLDGIALQLPDGTLEVDTVKAYWGLSSLLHASLVPSRFVFDAPHLTMEQRKTSWQIISAEGNSGNEAVTSTADLSELASFLEDVTLIIKNGSFAISASPQVDEGNGTQGFTIFSGANLAGTFRFPGLLPGFLDVSLEQGNLQRDGRLFSATRLNLRMQDIAHPVAQFPFVSFNSFEAGLTTSWPGVCETLSATLDLAVLTPFDAASPKFKGALNLDGMLTGSPQIPLKVEIPFTASQHHKLSLKNAAIRLDSDSVFFEGNVRIPNAWAGLPPMAGTGGVTQADKQENSPVFSGTVMVNHLSLPRWFEFARALPAGVEYALNDLSGEMDVELTSTSLQVSRLSALLSGIRFVGTGSVADFSKPDIVIKAHAQTADINAILPELVHKAPQPLQWQGPPPVTIDPDSQGPDYDIHLTAGTASAWRFKTGAFSFRCTPISDGSKLAIQAGNFYNGKIDAVVGISDVIKTVVTFTQVDLDQPVRLVAGFPALSGVFTGNATLSGDDQSFDHFLASLAGAVQGRVQGGAIGNRSNTGHIPFESMDIAFKASGMGLAGAALPSTLPFIGEWNISLHTPEWTGGLKLDGVVELDSGSFALTRFREVPGVAHWSGRGINVRADAKFSLDVPGDSLAVSGAKGTLNEGNLSGRVTGKALSADTEWAGKINFNTVALRQLLAKNNLLPAGMPESALRELEFSAEFLKKGAAFQAKELTGRLDDTRFTGIVEKPRDKTGAVKMELSLGTFNLSRYLPVSPPEQKATSWPVDLFDNLVVAGTVKIDSFRVASLVQRAVVIPFTLQDKTLACKPVVFSPYNGQGAAELTVQAYPEGYRARLVYDADNVDTALFSHEAGFRTILSGRTRLHADLAGLLRNGHDIPAGISGNWDVQTLQGAITELKPDGKAGTPTPFRSISASGTIHYGIMNTNNITLSSKQLKANGSAVLDLVKWTIDSRLYVTTAAFTNVPVTYKGNLNSPERSINALNAVAGAIGKLGSGLFGLVGDILSAPLKLIQ